MAFRSMEVSALCSFCGARSTGPCVRCGTPLCAHHQHRADTRCQSCELLYRKKTVRLRRLVAAGHPAVRRSVAAVPLLLVAFPAAIASLFDLVTSPFYVGTLVVCLFCSTLTLLGMRLFLHCDPPLHASQARLRRKRARFMKQRPRRRGA